MTTTITPNSETAAIEAASQPQNCAYTNPRNLPPWLAAKPDEFRQAFYIIDPTLELSQYQQHKELEEARQMRVAKALEQSEAHPRTAMNFPGTNSLTLNEDAILAAMRSILPMLVGARITALQMCGYPTRLEVDFTTDPEPPTPAV